MRKHLQNIALLVCAIIFSAVLCEGIFYFLNWLSPPLREIETTEGEPFQEWLDVVQYHPIYGHAGLPNVKETFYGKSITHNSKGFRGPEVDYRKPEGIKRVVFIGDSQTWGWAVSDEETIPHFAGRMLNERTNGAAYEVVNLGVTGYCIGQSYLLFLAEGLQYDPDYVVLTFFADNDIWGTSTMKAWGVEKPYVFEKADGGLCVSNVPPKRASGWPSDNLGYIIENSFNLERLRIVLPGFEFDLTETQTFAYFKSRSINTSLINISDGDGNSVMEAIVENIGCVKSEPGPARATPEEQVGLVVKIVNEIRTMVERRGGKFYVVTKPTKEDYERNRLRNDYQLVLARLRQLGIEVVDMFTVAKEKGMTKEQLFIDYGHLSVGGNNLIAESVVEKIVSVETAATSM
ncbi:MAG TPA: SGNH/GDSL hydrolase family protein [Gammaproteobacteria bacterium]